MKNMLMYFWHGEDIGKRLFLGAIAAGTLIGTYGVPQTPQEWVAAGVVFLTGTVSKGEEAARKVGARN